MLSLGAGQVKSREAVGSADLAADVSGIPRRPDLQCRPK